MNIENVMLLLMQHGCILQGREKLTESILKESDEAAVIPKEETKKEEDILDA